MASNNTAVRMVLTGVSFNNPALPKLSPFTISGFIADGLVAGYLPKDTLSSMRDVSGNGNSLSVKGSPEFTSSGVKVSAQNAFLSDIAEPLDYTAFVVYRTYQTEPGVTQGCMLANFLYIPDNRGSGIYDRGLVESSDATYLSSGSVRCFVATSGGGTQTDTSETLRISSNGGPKQPTNWLFFGTRINTSAVEKQTGFRPAYTGNPLSSIKAGDFTGSTENSWKNRLRSSGGIPHTLAIGTDAGGSYTGTGVVEIAQVGLYNRALSDAELWQQYDISKQWLAAASAIDVQ